MEQTREDRWVRKTVMMRESMWQEIDGIRADERLGSEADALRRVVAAGLKALKGDAP